MNASSSSHVGGTDLLPRRAAIARPQVAAHTEEDAERGRDGADARRVEPRAAQPDAIDAAHRVRPVHDGERRHVATGARQAAQDREAADAHVLVDDAVARDERLIVDHRRGPPPARRWQMIARLPMRQLWATCARAIT